MSLFVLDIYGKPYELTIILLTRSKREIGFGQTYWLEYNIGQGFPEWRIMTRAEIFMSGVPKSDNPKSVVEPLTDRHSLTCL